ncbi:TetR/AcrR family transcriptional regulator [Actinospongicola halichondriae]|uniref:TetR/AcrR family transcriptional regulator n=1 Tax=Actinospongicola halichondriae TaxID=3236844 RepID=UPI003D3E756D
MSVPATVDRAAAIRSAVVRLVARQGFHGTSMAAIAREAGVGTGTAYVHYESKDDLVLATYVEVKEDLGRAATRDLRPGDTESTFRQLWFRVHDHLADDPDRARFLLQVDTSPYAHEAHSRSMDESGDGLLDAAAAAGMMERFAPLPLLVIFDLALGPAIRLVASGERLDARSMETLCDACWRAVTV